MTKRAGGLIDSHLTPLLRQHGLTLIVPERVQAELKRLARHRESETSAKAKRAIELVRRLRETQVAEIYGDASDTFADNLFLTQFTRLRLKYRLLLFTQDRKLAHDTVMLNHGSSVDRIHGIDVFRVGDHGDPMRWELDDQRRDGVAYRVAGASDGFRPARRSPPVREKPGVQPFRSLKRVAQLEERPVPVSVVPSEGDRVSDSSGRTIRLVKELGRGGEGTVFATDQGTACKIYAAGKLRRYQVDKIRLMASRTIDHPGICWPQSLVSNTKGEAVGYTMRKGTGIELKRGVFIKPLMKQRFPLWNRLHLVRLTRSILDAIAYLHDLNVVLGDINARNILVVSDQEVYFVDCDSYQVEGYPCPVGMPPFLAPELHGVHLPSTLRNMESERFAVATLVFMLLHPGKPPYSHQGGEDPSKNVRNRHFAYPLGDQHGDRVPPGAWRYMWSHLPYYMKETFHQVFSDGQRLKLDDWIELLGRYENDLRKGYVSDDAFPTGFKRLKRGQVEKKGGRWLACDACGEGFGSFGPHETTCRTCRHKRHLTQAATAKQTRSARPSSPQPRQRTPTRRRAPSPRRSSPPHRPAPPPPPHRPAPSQQQQPGVLDSLLKLFSDLFS